ncbi:class I SAM-dependent methyltransferase [Rhizobiales bacterium]|uniref:class I SAM-dependent methyltransferase n=1 Tax=Hongsoonwoonella zoysiae TaxID=2821844 RepID=UPI0015603F4B|nr:class I SAM-dependent methyltransferase [Hongsoonwoonella zoysiae]NRG18934.1 class I SAM-dependent methyltransferase [Hongsoonwoonella zoysiae]
MDDLSDPRFHARRLAIRDKVAALRAENSRHEASGGNDVRDIYAEAGCDATAVPWADLAPKPELIDWLSRNPGQGMRAIDVACGLGDNAEAISAAGYRTTAFDLSRCAVDWALQRFPETGVEYRQADLLDVPHEWRGAFDLVHECHTIQTLNGKARDKAFSAISDLLAPGGILLVLASLRSEDAQVPGPPWPLTPSELARFAGFGLVHDSERRFSVTWFGREYPQIFQVWRRVR